MRGLGEPWAIHVAAIFMPVKLHAMRVASLGGKPPEGWTPPPTVAKPPVDAPAVPKPANDF